MNGNGLKARIAAAMVAIAVAGMAMPASAKDVARQSGAELQQAGFFDRGHHRGHRRFRAMCEPHEAMRKAAFMGLRRPGIRRISHRVIVVSGINRGHRAQIVFARQSPRCNVIGDRGI